MARGSDTATRVLWGALERHGYVQSIADFARVLRVDPKNASAYLAPRGERRRRIKPRLDTISQWCWAISQTTSLSVGFSCDPSGEIVIEISGFHADGTPIPVERKVTNYREIDQAPLRQWEREWGKFLEDHTSFYVESRKSNSRG